MPIAHGSGHGMAIAGIGFAEPPRRQDGTGMMDGGGMDEQAGDRGREGCREGMQPREMIDAGWLHRQCDGIRLRQLGEGGNHRLQGGRIRGDRMGWDNRGEIGRKDGEPMSMFGDVEGCNGGRWCARMGHVILPKGHGQINATMGVNKSIVACMIA